MVDKVSMLIALLAAQLVEASTSNNSHLTADACCSVHNYAAICLYRHSSLHAVGIIAGRQAMYYTYLQTPELVDL